MKIVSTVIMMAALVMPVAALLSGEEEGKKKKKKDSATTNTTSAVDDHEVPWLVGSPLMRTTLPQGDAGRRATLRMSGLGWSFAVVNGRRVDPTRQLDPGWTYYRRNALVSTFDITPFLHADKTSDLQVFLGGGHFASDWYQGQGETLLYAEVHYHNNATKIIAQGGGEENSKTLVRSILTSPDGVVFLHISH